MKKSVLIVEDDEVQQKLLKKLVLEVNGCAAVYTAGSLNPAYKILLEKTIDAFLVDIILDTKKRGILPVSDWWKKSEPFLNICLLRYCLSVRLKTLPSIPTLT